LRKVKLVIKIKIKFDFYGWSQRVEATKIAAATTTTTEKQLQH